MEDFFEYVLPALPKTKKRLTRLEKKRIEGIRMTPEYLNAVEQLIDIYITYAIRKRMFEMFVTTDCRCKLCQHMQQMVAKTDMEMRFAQDAYQKIHKMYLDDLVPIERTEDGSI